MERDDETTSPYIAPDEKPGEDELKVDADEPEGVIIGGAVGGPPGVALGQAVEGEDAPGPEEREAEREKKGGDERRRPA